MELQVKTYSKTLKLRVKKKVSPYMEV